MKNSNKQYTNYVGFGLKLSDAEELAKKVYRSPYAFDAEGQMEFNRDLEDLHDKLQRLYLDYLSLKGEL
jgi:hypothetical protein